jgi:NADH-quinone oxidoreductase subunit M
MQSQYLPSVIALISGLAAFLLRGQDGTVKFLAALACVAMFIATIVIHLNSLASVMAMLLVILVAVACILCQRVVKFAQISTATILIVLGLLSLALYGEPLIAKIAQGFLLFALAILSFCFRKNESLGLGATVAFSVSLVSLLLSCLMQGSWSLTFQLLSVVTLLPLFPFHVGYIGMLENLPGTVPAFLALGMPLLGWHALAQLSSLPAHASQVIMVLILIGVLITGSRAFMQAGLKRVVGAVATLLMTQVWWLLVSNTKPVAELGPYVLAVGMVASGLALCASCLEARYGTQSLKSLPGLARTMPKFGVVFSLLIMAGAGIPFFAVFSSFILVLISLRFEIADLFFVSVIWIGCFAIQISILQELLFNQPRSNLVYTDLSRIELFSLAVILVLLIAGGVFPKMMLGLMT